MPKYLYFCSTCGDEFFAYHLMSERLEKREECEDECLLKRLPSFPINVNKNKKEQKTGNVVKQHIKDAKEDLKNEQKKLKEKEYKP